MDPGLRGFVLLETDAREFYNYEIDFIPGLLQHTDYARAIAQFGHPDWSERQKDRLLSDARHEDDGVVRCDGVVEV